MKVCVSVLVSIYSASGCTPTPVDPKIRLQTTCADSFKLSLKDPDSLVIVANLGVRGVSENEGKGFWLRYKAKNAYGAFVSSNVYCRIESDGTATRDTLSEHLSVLDEANSILEATIRGMQAGKKHEEVNWGDTDALANRNVFESPEALLLMNYYKP